MIDAGTDAWGNADRWSWRSGRWALELRGDEFADVSYDGVRVLRSVRAVVRDRDWRTAPLIVDDVRLDAGTLALTVHSAELGSSFAGVVHATVDENVLEIACDLVAREDVETNRTGLVVLHPPTLAGTPLAVTHAAGAPEETAFPVRISAHQPVRDIAGLRWDAGGIAIELGFDGDVFEMEDQRNWTDASFKTYSRPLDLPFPYRIDAGGHVAQRVRIVAGRAEPVGTGDPADRRSSASTIVLTRGAHVPRIGLGAATAPDPAPAFAAIGSHVLVELDLADTSWPAALARAARQEPGGPRLDVRLVLSDDEPGAIDEAVRALRGPDVIRVTAFPPTGPSRHVSDAAAVDTLRTALRRAGLDAPVVAGTRAHFTELNREHHRLPSAAVGVDGIVFSSTPLFHSTDTDQLVESVAIQRRVALEAVEIAAGLPVHIGPITLRPRFNDVATTAHPRSGRTDLAAGYGPELHGGDDPRQDSPELGAWTVASAAAFAVPGVDSLAFFEEWGPRGIRTADGEERPVAVAMRALVDIAGPDAEPARLLRGDSPDGLLWAIGGDATDGATVLVANLDRVARAVALELPDGRRIEARVAAGRYVRLALTPMSRRGSRAPD